jgi:HEXXH motif-containing protein
VSFINIRSAPGIRLAEDLLHEAVHERLHRIERVHPLVAPESPRVYSPWRREWRPLRGLVHGACTFGAGASFFSRALAASGGARPALRLTRARRLWLARRLVEEWDALGEALRILAAARREGWLRPAGIRLESEVRAGWRALRSEAVRCLALLERTPAARGHVAALRRQRERTGARAVRWSAGWSPSVP